MSVFKEHRTNADRVASDRRRHNQKIEKAIREGIHNIVADESIIGQNGKKKFRIPVRGIKEHKFVYGDNGEQAGSAPGKDIKRGQKIGDKSKDQGGKPDKASNEKGEEYYDVEMTLDELAQYLFSDLELPDLQKKQLTDVVSEKLKRSGYRTEGILPRLDKKKTAIMRIKRMKAADFKPEEAEEGETFSFHEEDLRYRHFKQKNEPCTNAVIFFVMDVSGSMTQDKKFLARSFSFLLYQFIRSKYDNIEVVFITHDMEAREVDENSFFTMGTSGGTCASTGLQLVNETIRARFHPSSWNIYVSMCSDGDNFDSDNGDYLEELKTVLSVSQKVCYCEIEPERSYDYGDVKLSKLIMPLVSGKLTSVRILRKEDVWDAFKQFVS